MNFAVTFIPDEEYYIEAYSEILTTLKFKKYELLFAIIMIIIGIILYFADIHRITGVFPIIFSCAGIYEFFKSIYEKKKWFADRKNAKVFGQQIELHFNDEIIKYSGPFSKGELSWNGVHKIVSTPKGIIIKPENGISIYLPKKYLENDQQMQFIISKQKNST